MNATVDNVEALTAQSIQQAVDAVAAAGGGTVRVPAGLYMLEDAVRLRSGVRLVGEPGTVLRKRPSVSSPLVQVCGFGHYEFEVKEPELFEIGMGVHVCDEKSRGFYDTTARIIARQGGRFFIDRPFQHDYHPGRGGRVASLYPLIEAADVREVSVTGLTLDGNVDETRVLNGCRGGAVFFIRSHRLTVENTRIERYRGDGLSFQQCTDLIVRGCELSNITGHGLHPGSGSVRYVLENCHIHDNGGCGIFYCLRTTHSQCRANRITGNGNVGISIGERDTHHLLENNIIVDNDLSGIEIRTPVCQSGDHLRILANTVGPNCRADDAEHEVRIAAGVRDVYLCDNTIVPRRGCAIALEGPAQAIHILGHEPGEVLDPAQCVRYDSPKAPTPLGPEALPLDGAMHLGMAQLPTWAGTAGAACAGA